MTFGDDWIEDDALRFEGFGDAQIAQIKAAIPQAEALVALVQKNQAAINQASILAKELLPVVQMILTVAKGRMT